MLNKTLQVLAFLLLPVTMLAGLAAAPLIASLMLLLCMRLYSGSIYSIFSYKAIFVFLLWSIISCIWSPHSMDSFILIIRVCLLVFAGLFIAQNINQIRTQELVVTVIQPICYGSCLAVILFIIEYYTHGAISTTARNIIGSSKSFFYLHFMDRGCSILTVFAWPMILHLLNSNKQILAIIFYAIVFTILIMSDSLASSLAFVCSGISFIILKISNMKVRILILPAMLASIILVPILAYKQDPIFLSDKYFHSKASAQHRLFIWHFVSHEAVKTPIIGRGFDSSRYIGDGQVVHYNNSEWSVLPLHPHNNILQIFLETGVIGLILFAALITSICLHIQKLKHSNAGACAFACLISYFCIGMIAFGAWQLWWVATGVFAFVMIGITTNDKSAA